jgi:hypothetical protein
MHAKRRVQTAIAGLCVACAGLIARASAATAPQVEGARKAVLLLTLLTVVLGVFLVAVIAVVVQRRIRRRESPPSRPQALVDPWSEAGRRVEPYRDEPT